MDWIMYEIMDESNHGQMDRLLLAVTNRNGKTIRIWSVFVNEYKQKVKRTAFGEKKTTNATESI